MDSRTLHHAANPPTVSLDIPFHSAMSERSNEEKLAAVTRIRILTACSDAVIWTYSVGGEHAHAFG